MLQCHDFINGEYYEDSFTGERLSVEEYWERKEEEEKRRECKHYILIKQCECIIHQTNFFCDLFRWHYNMDERRPEEVIILSANEYLKNENGTFYYRAYDGDHYLSLKLKTNKELKIDNVEEVLEFLLCTTKGHGVLYTKEQFIKEFA